MIRDQRQAVRGTRFRELFAGLWKLTRPYYASGDRWWAWGLSVLILTFIALGTTVAVGLADWIKDFFDALEQKDGGAVAGLVVKFVGLVFMLVVFEVLDTWAGMMLEFRWRHWLTDQFFVRYLQDGRYHLLELVDYGIDNADQRISVDLSNLTRDTIGLATGLIRNFIYLVSFSALLWGLSGMLEFTFLGREWVIQGYLVWIAIFWGLLTSVGVHFFGRSLIPLRNRQEQYEADLRALLVHIRKNAEAICLSAGQQRENLTLRHSFEVLQINFFSLVRYSALVNGFRNFTNLSSAMVISNVANAPRLLAGQITLGVLMESQTVFQRVQQSLGWFVNSYENIASWKASVDRVLLLQQALERASADRNDSKLQQAVSEESSADIRATGLSVSLPDGGQLLDEVNLQISKGERLLVTGPSGSGKTTLFRTLAGIWPWAKGKVSLPQGGCMFLPQRAFVPSGSLAEALAYPKDLSDFLARDLENALEACNLGQLKDELHSDRAWSRTLSGGEKQRVAFARVLLHKPAWLFLDEATSALDLENEAALYATVSRLLPNTSIISIAHRTSLEGLHSRRLNVVPGSKSILETGLNAETP